MHKVKKKKKEKKKREAAGGRKKKERKKRKNKNALKFLGEAQGQMGLSTPEKGGVLTVPFVGNGECWSQLVVGQGSRTITCPAIQV